MNINIPLEPLLALVAGIAAIVLPAKLATRVVGVYLVGWAVLELANVI
mgnify:CR=1 FL=1